MNSVKKVTIERMLSSLKASVVSAASAAAPCSKFSSVPPASAPPCASSSPARPLNARSYCPENTTPTHLAAP